MHRIVAIVVALLLLCGSGALTLGAALGQLVDGPSPARGGASVVAQGVAPMPAGDIAWRVTRATVPAEGPLAERSGPGFILVEAGTLLLEHVAANTQTRLAASEAAFVPAGPAPQEIVAGDATTSYFRIDLVPAAEVTTAGIDELPFVGEPFAAPAGSRDLDLVREVLDADETVELALAAEAGPVLFFVSEGTIDLVPASNPSATPVSLPAGQGAALSGDVIATAAGGESAAFVLAVIGPEAPPILAQEAAPPPSSIAVQAAVCPVAYEGSDYATDCVEPLANTAFSLVSATTGLSTDATTGGDGAVAFTELAADTYVLTSGVPGEFASQAVSCADPSGASGVESTTEGPPGAAITLAVGSDVTCAWYVVPQDMRGESVGTVAVTVWLCPGSPLDPAADCTPGDATGVVVAGPVTLTTEGSSEAPVRIRGESWIWGEDDPLPSGEYGLHSEGIVVPEGYELAEVRGSAGATDAGWTFTIDESNANAVLELIYVPAQPAADVDSDQDGLGDAQETEIGSDPANPDSDADGLFDGPEVAAGTAPTLADTDGDGFDDNLEAVNASNPLDAASVPATEPAVDTDGDGLSDADETGIGSDPNLFDTDGDGVDDGTEVANGTGPLDSASF